MALNLRQDHAPIPTRCPACHGPVLKPPPLSLADRTRAGLAPLPDGGLDGPRPR